MQVLKVSADSVNADNRDIIYNCLDSMNTFALYEHFEKNVPGWAKAVGRYSEKMLGPIMTMMRRGVLIDQKARDEVVNDLSERLARVRQTFDFLCESILGCDININSNPQLKVLFFNFLAIPELTSVKKGETKIGADRATLEKIVKEYPRGEPFARMILRIRDLEKQIEFLTKGLSEAGRFHSSYNLAGTDTFRLSSQEHPLRIGSNAQNLPKHARRIFVADPGYLFFQADQQGAEARYVAYKTGDENYINAVESGDSHTMVASMVFGFEPIRELAEREYYRGKSYRDVTKSGAHGCLTADHEVLTPNGWVSIAKKPPVIAGWSRLGSEWVKPTHWTEVESNESIQLKGPSLSAVATPCHRFIVENDGRFFFRRADELKSSDRIPYTSNDWFGGDQIVHHPELIAAFQADGNLTPKGLVRFKFRRQRKIERMRLLLSDYPGEWTESVYGKDTVFSLRKSLSTAVSAYGKIAGPHFLTWSSISLSKFAEESLFWDGAVTHKSGRRAVSSMSLEHCKWLQTIFQLVGYGSKVIDNTGKTSDNYSGKRAHWVSANNRSFAAVRSMERNYCWGKSQKFYCPTVSGECFWVRHNGNMYVSGNSNYLGKPFTLAQQMKVEKEVAEAFQLKYFKRFPGIPAWHQYVAKQIQSEGRLSTAFGIRRTFWDRKWDDSTLRKAVAFEPQSTVGILTNVALHRLWDRFEGKPGAPVQILMNGHDAAIGQIRKDLVDELLPQVLECLTFPLEITDINGKTRTAIIPWDIELGDNWGKYHPEKNPGGLRKWESKQ